MQPIKLLHPVDSIWLFMVHSLSHYRRSSRSEWYQIQEGERSHSWYSGGRGRQLYMSLRPT